MGLNKSYQPPYSFANDWSRVTMKPRPAHEVGGEDL